MPYATLAQLKEYLGVTVTSDDLLLARLLNAAEAAIDRKTGRRFESSTKSVRVMRADFVGDRVLLPDDLRSVTSFISDTGDALSASEYVIPDVPTRFVIVDRVPDMEHYSTITGAWGYSATAPADITQATIRLAGHYYRLKDTQAYDVAGLQQTGLLSVAQRMPADVEALIASYVAREVRTW